MNLSQFIKESGNEYASIVDDGVAAGDVNDYIDTLRERVDYNLKELSEDIDKKNAFLEFSTNVRPKLSEFSDKLNRKIIDHPKLDNLPERYNLIIKSIRTDIEIFRKENIPLSVRQTELVTESQSINGSMTVVFDGKERTLPEKNEKLETKKTT